MSIALTYPRYAPDTNLPLGIAYIGANLQKHGFDVCAIDQTFEAKKSFDAGAIDQSFGGKKTLEAKLKKADPDVVGVSGTTMNYFNCLEVAEKAKQLNPAVKVVFGNAHTTIVPDEVIREKNIDAIVLGEGEETFVELAERLEKGKTLKGVKGLWYKQGKKIVRNGPRPLIKNLDELPFPARDLFPVQEYMDNINGRASWAVEPPSLTMISSRGCPYHCTYCGIHNIFGPSVRFRSPENTVAEIQELKEKYKINGLFFWDDTFTINKKRAIEICNKIIENKLDFEWCVQARVDTVDRELLAKMKKAGCVTLCYGIESGSQRILDNYLKKGITLEQVKTAVNISKELGFITHGYFMVGIPGEKPEDIDATIKLSRNLGLDAAEFAMLAPFVGTEIREIAKKEGELLYKKSAGLESHHTSIIKTKHLNPEIIRKKYDEAISGFYFRPKYLLEQLLKIRSYNDLKRRYKGFLMVFNVLNKRVEHRAGA